MPRKRTVDPSDAEYVRKKRSIHSAREKKRVKKIGEAFSTLRLQVAAMGYGDHRSQLAVLLRALQMVQDMARAIAALHREIELSQRTGSSKAEPLVEPQGHVSIDIYGTAKASLQRYRHVDTSAMGESSASQSSPPIDLPLHPGCGSSVPPTGEPHLAPRGKGEESRVGDTVLRRQPSFSNDCGINSSEKKPFLLPATSLQAPVACVTPAPQHTGIKRKKDDSSSPPRCRKPRAEALLTSVKNVPFQQQQPVTFDIDTILRYKRRNNAELMASEDTSTKPGAAHCGKMAQRQCFPLFSECPPTLPYQTTACSSHQQSYGHQATTETSVPILPGLRGLLPITTSQHLLTPLSCSPEAPLSCSLEASLFNSLVDDLGPPMLCYGLLGDDGSAYCLPASALPTSLPTGHCFAKQDLVRSETAEKSPGSVRTSSSVCAKDIIHHSEVQSTVVGRNQNEASGLGAADATTRENNPSSTGAEGNMMDDSQQKDQHQAIAADPIALLLA